MQEIQVSVTSFLKLLDYMESLGLDVDSVAIDAGINLSELHQLPAEGKLSARLYSHLYKQAVKEMQKMHPHIPWAAGLGTEAFEMLCHAIMGCATLGEALERAVRFETLLRPLSGRRLALHSEGDVVRLEYQLDTDNVASLFAPPCWRRASSYETVALASGLVVWHAFCGWLVGHSLSATRINVSHTSIGDAYRRSLENLTGCTVYFSQAHNCIEFPKEALDYRVVQDQRSVQQFLDMAVYQLSMVERQPASISDAIKFLIGRDFSVGVPSFTEVADRLHLSESSLRRKLLKEQTTFQIIKDQVRCDLAKNYLVESDLKINDVSEALGFTEPSSFVRSFKNWTGYTPKSYREHHQETLKASL